MCLCLWCKSIHRILTVCFVHGSTLKSIKILEAASKKDGATGRLLPLDRVDSAEDLKASLQLSEEEMYHRVTACERPSSCQDGFLDIVSIRGAFHLGQIRVGLSNAQKLCQCREAKIIIKRKVSVQIDGEPWRQNVCTLHVKRKKEAALMLHRSANDSNGVETEMTNLLDWAEERQLITDRVHDALMKEFSRRIESKTRERREKRLHHGSSSTGTFSQLTSQRRTTLLAPSTSRVA